MRKMFVCLLLLVAGCVSALRAQVYQAKPKLVVVLVIDQFRGDYLERYRDSITSANGFNLFLKKGGLLQLVLLRLCEHQDGSGACDDRDGGLYGWAWDWVE